jgi:hypothetical protein
MQTDQNEWVDVNEQAKLPILRDVVSGKYVYNILMSQSEHYNIIFDQVIQAHVVYDKRKFHSFLGPDGYIGYGFNCGETRIIKVQDEFHVKRCKKCQKAHTKRRKN